jgi:hypothetical protein
MEAQQRQVEERKMSKTKELEEKRRFEEEQDDVQRQLVKLQILQDVKRKEQAALQAEQLRLQAQENRAR